MCFKNNWLFKRGANKNKEKQSERWTRKRNEKSDVVSNRGKHVVYYHCSNHGLIMAVEPTRTWSTSASISLTANRSRQRQRASRQLICVIRMKKGKERKHRARLTKCYISLKRLPYFVMHLQAHVLHRSIRLIRAIGVVQNSRIFLLNFLNLLFIHYSFFHSFSLFLGFIILLICCIYFKNLIFNVLLD